MIASLGMFVISCGHLGGKNMDVDDKLMYNNSPDEEEEKAVVVVNGHLKEDKLQVEEEDKKWKWLSEGLGLVKEDSSIKHDVKTAEEVWAYNNLAKYKLNRMNEPEKAPFYSKDELDDLKNHKADLEKLCNDVNAKLKAFNQYAKNKLARLEELEKKKKKGLKDDEKTTLNDLRKEENDLEELLQFTEDIILKEVILDAFEKKDFSQLGKCKENEVKTAIDHLTYYRSYLHHNNHHLNEYEKAELWRLNMIEGEKWIEVKNKYREFMGNDKKWKWLSKELRRLGESIDYDVKTAKEVWAYDKLAKCKSDQMKELKLDLATFNSKDELDDLKTHEANLEKLLEGTKPQLNSLNKHAKDKLAQLKNLEKKKKDKLSDNEKTTLNDLKKEENDLKKLFWFTENALLEDTILDDNKKRLVVLKHINTVKHLLYRHSKLVSKRDLTWDEKVELNRLKYLQVHLTDLKKTLIATKAKLGHRYYSDLAEIGFVVAGLGAVSTLVGVGVGLYYKWFTTAGFTFTPFTPYFPFTGGAWPNIAIAAGVTAMAVVISGWAIYSIYKLYKKYIKGGRVLQGNNMENKGNDDENHIDKDVNVDEDGDKDVNDVQ